MRLRAGERRTQVVNDRQSDDWVNGSGDATMMW
jgi:hypothetical protein